MHNFKTREQVIKFHKQLEINKAEITEILVINVSLMLWKKGWGCRTNSMAVISQITQCILLCINAHCFKLILKLLLLPSSVYLYHQTVHTYHQTVHMDGNMEIFKKQFNYLDPVFI